MNCCFMRMFLNADLDFYIFFLNLYEKHLFLDAFQMNNVKF